MRGSSIVVKLLAWDTETNEPVVGDAANISLHIVKDAGTPTSLGAPSAADNTVENGYYEVRLSAAQHSADTKSFLIGGKSTTESVIILPTMLYYARRGEDFTAYYFAWDKDTGNFKAGDSANHTMHISKDGATPVSIGAGTEIDAANLPGLYYSAISESNADADSLNHTGESTTADI